MRNLRFVIEYDGTNFYGWQYQPNKRTIQGEIEDALKKITNENIKIIGAGRTDQGIHALGQIANFHTSTPLDTEQIKRGVNSLVREDIYVKKIEEVGSTFNSRYSAKSKIYRYHITLEPSPFKMRYNWFVKYSLQLSAIRKVIPYVVNEHDFKNFSVCDGNHNTRCNVNNVNLTQNGSQIIIEIEGDRFLRKMVRRVIGFMVDVGRGRFSPHNTDDVFAGKIQEIYFAPPQGLFLVEVKY